MAKVKIDIPTIKRRLKSLENMDNILFKVTTKLKDIILKGWNRQIGADGNQMPNLKEPYASKKPKDIRNLLLSGNMRRSLDPVRKDKDSYVLKFTSADEVAKARNNQKYAKNMMSPISDKTNSTLQRLAFRLYKEQ